MTTSIRAAKSTDQAFVANSWMSSLSGPKKNWGPDERGMNETIDRLLDDKRTQVLIACETASPDRIVGWVAFARIPGARVLEFVLVRKDWRGQGIAQTLLERADLVGPGAPVTALFEEGARVMKFVHTQASYVTPEEFLL